MISLFSLERPPEESAFLRLEMDLEWAQVNNQCLEEIISKNIHLGKRTPIVISDAALYERLLSASPQASIVAFLLADEAYNPKTLRILRKHNSVHCVFRNYAIDKAELTDIVRQLMRVFSQLHGTTEKKFEILRMVLVGLRTRKRM